MTPSNDDWVKDVERQIADFASQFGTTYSVTERQQSAAFEIGCLLRVIDDYQEQNAIISVQNLGEDGGFRYLTSPSGKPANFSWLRVQAGPHALDLRQQVRVRSHFHPDVTFTPDFVLLDADAPIEQRRDPDFAGGKRGLFAVDSAAVVSAFECKSLPGFPELFISFVGMLMAAHNWVDDNARGAIDTYPTGHLAPTLFVGGVPSNLHKRMVAGLEQALPMNIVTGLHRGGWTKYRQSPLRRLPLQLAPG